MFINKKTNVKTENLALNLLDITVGLFPILGYVIIYVFNEKSISLLFTLMMMICFNIFVKIFLVKKEKKII